VSNVQIDDEWTFIAPFPGLERIKVLAVIDDVATAREMTTLKESTFSLRDLVNQCTLYRRNGILQ